MTGRVLIIAGSDSGGGAGIQADIKTVTALGGFAATAVTALTAQNTLGVDGIFEIPPDFVRQQIQVVLRDIGADCLKTGMLHNAEMIEAVAATIAAEASGLPLVVDPVMVAKGGVSLLRDDAVAALIKHLVPRATVLTPNLPETAALTGRSVETVEDMREAGKTLLAMGAHSVLVKGGHMEGAVLTDLLLTQEDEFLYESERINTRHTHGTGCTTASAIAASLAQGLSIPAAVERARAYVREAILTAPGLGRGHGPLNHGHPFRTL